MTHQTDEQKRRDAAPNGQPIEDWRGCDLEQASCFEVRRAFNGVVVLPTARFDRDTTVTGSPNVLVFQNPEHFWSWFSGWLTKTSATP